MSQASTTVAPFAFSPEAHAQLAAWVAPRKPWGFDRAVTELEQGAGEVALIFAPGRPDQFFAMISGGAQGGADVCDEQGNGGPVADMTEALEVVSRWFASVAERKAA
jgi:hypothetical protein